jgi:GDP/UDP-N,N'-diacetylbacillosamine 2-epimerase (hydrolysing)
LIIGILTSSRADFGIYLPLLKKMQRDNFFKIEIIAFGTHLSPFHGYTIDQIKENGFDVSFQVESLLIGDSTEAISTAMALTSIKFSSFWASYKDRFDLIFCLGDRYEMFAAVTAAIPYGLKFAHFHGGEKTLGAIDNIFRDSISLIAKKHFVSTQEYALRIERLIDSKEEIYNIGSLSLDNLLSESLYSKEDFYEKWKINLNFPTILVTLHPETIALTKNREYAQILAGVIKQLGEFQVVITMPNVDTQGSVIRSVWHEEFSTEKKIHMIENFGTTGYFSCMKHCRLLLGNTSSGIIEAASLNRYVINLGDRQKGRLRGANVFDCSFEEKSIISLVKKVLSLPEYPGGNIYWNGGAANKVIDILKESKGN